jgi:hypothetical protein
MKTRTFCLLLIFGTGWFAGMRAAELPKAVIPQGVGVNIHFSKGHEMDLDLIAAAGFRFVRMDLTWAAIERKPGEYDWSAYDELIANLDKRNLRALFILCYSNPLYEETVTMKNKKTGKSFQSTAAPRHPESVAAFARWAAAAAKHFRGRHIIWEVWNEPNIGFWKPKPDVRQYADLLLATGKAIREADPEATLVAPASSGFPWPFFEELFKAGALEYLDAVSVHPYRDFHKSPETAAEDYEKLRALIARFAPPEKKNLPIISGEWGYSTHTKGASLETQAAFIVRQQLANLLQGVRLSIWYDWKNDGPDPNENEHNFGTVYPDLRPKPSYRAIQTMTRELDGFRIVRRVATPDANDYVLLCENTAGKRKCVAWTVAEAHDASLDLKDIPRLKLTAEPQYIVIPTQ